MRRERVIRPLALFLAFVMCISMLPVSAMTQEYKDELIVPADELARSSTLITPEEVIAGSTYPSSAHIETKNLIDGSGMSDDSLTATCSNSKTDGSHWHTDVNPGANAWVQVDLGQVYELDELWIWNMNQAEANGRGFKNVKIEYSETGENGSWTALVKPADMPFTDGSTDYPFQFAQASGQEGQAATNLNDGSNTPVNFGGASARYVKLTADPDGVSGTWGNDGYYGLSELRFTGRPTSGVELNIVTYALENLVKDQNAPTAIAEGETLEFTLSTPSGYNLPETVEIVMDGITLVAPTDYTYDNATGAINVPSIKGDVVITASGVGEATPPVGAGVWKMQKFGGDADIEMKEGWIVPDSEGVGFSIDYGAVYQDNDGSVAIYDSTAPTYRDSILELDFTVTGETGGKIQTAFFPRFKSGKNCTGFAVGEPAQIQHSYQVNGNEGWPGVSNELGMSFAVGTTYHLKFITIGNSMAVYVGSGAEQKRLTTFNTASEIDEGGYGFRIWGQVTDKTVHIANIVRSEYIQSVLGKSEVVIKTEDWGTGDVTIPLTLGAGDSVKSITNGMEELTLSTDYTVSDDSITLNKSYIASISNSFTLKVAFTKGSEAAFAVTKLENTRTEYVWTPDKGVDEWTKLFGKGTFVMTEDSGAMHITGNVALMNVNSPLTRDGEVEITLQALNDDFRAGILFRGESVGNTWQGVQHDDDYALMKWFFKNNDGINTQIHGDGSFSLSRAGEADTKLKARIQGDTVTIWIDDQFMYTGTVSQANASLGRMGLLTGNNCEILVKKVIFRTVLPTLLEADDSDTTTIAKGGLTVSLASDFPRVKEYALNGKILKGTEFKHNYVTINTVDYPAAATATVTSDSVTYHIVPDGSEVTFDVAFTVLDGNVLDMHIKNISEPDGELVYSLGLPNQPLISANSTQSGAKLDAAGFQESFGSFHQSKLGESHYAISEDKVSKTADTVATIPVITTSELSASMANNVLLNIQEFKFRAFDLPGGGVSAGFWNNEFMYRGLDGEKIFPIASEPEEPDLYCKVVLTEDTNEDDILDWQDGANALKTIISDKIPGGKEAARSFFEVGYNFVSEAQQPFLQVEDNLKRMSNLIDGFDQILVLKGYANEGHDSAHADYDDINKRAGGAKDLSAMSEAIEEINSTFGVHINHTEAYPEAAMYNDHVISDKNAWAWMDQSKNIRREADILNTNEGQSTMDERLDSMFAKASNNGTTPGIGFVYVDTYTDDRWCETRLADALIRNGAMIGTENQNDFDRYNNWVHWPEISATGMHHFVYNTQKDVYNNSGLYWGGYGRSASFMSWQHNTSINPVVEQFYTNQLPQKYLMCHDVRKQTDGEAFFEGNVRTTSDYKIYKDEHLIAGDGKIFIPWFAKDSTTRNPDEAAKIYHWNSTGGSSTWYLPASWSNQATVQLYQLTQTGKVLVDGALAVTSGQITIDAQSKTPYVVYPGSATVDLSATDWSVGSPIKDTGFNSRDFSIWQDSGEADIQFNDNGDGVSILTISGTEAGQISQTMTGLTPGQKYRAIIWAGSENGKTARITVKDGDKVYSNYVDQTVRANNCFDTYARNMRVDRLWVDFTATETTAEIILSADACENATGKATFMQSRIVETADPGFPTSDPTKNYAAYETFEYVEQGGTGVFTPEGGGDGGYHLSGSHPPYTDDAIATGPNGEVSTFSLKKQGGQMRTRPSTMRLMPNTEYTLELDALGSGTVEIVSEADGNDKPMRENFSKGHTKLNFTTGDKLDYIARIEGGFVIDNFQVYSVADPTPPTTPTLTAEPADNGTSVTLSWTAATDEDSGISGYIVYRNGVQIARVGIVVTYTDVDIQANTTYSYEVSAVNSGNTEGSKSNVAKVEIGDDTTAPKLLSSELKNGSIILTFNERLDKESAEALTNYTFTGAVTAVTASASGKMVTLTITGMGAAETVKLTISGVKDLSGNPTDGVEVTLSYLFHYFKFDETEGLTAVDSAGHENAAKADTVKVTDGKMGKAAQFSANGYADVSGAGLVDQNTFTLSAWIKWDGKTNESQTIFSNGASGDPGSHGIWFHIRNDSRLWASSNQCGDLNSGDKTIPVGEWVHVAAVRRSDGNDLYLNGEKVASNNVPDDMSGYNSKLRIGGNYNTSNSLLHKFKGAIDEFKIYTSALSEAEVRALAKEGMPPQIIDTDLTAIQSAGRAMSARVDFNGAGVTSIKEDGSELVLGQDYSASNTAVTFTGAYLNTLAIGVHTLTVSFDDAAATTGSIVITVEAVRPGVHLNQRFVRLEKDGTTQLAADVVPVGGKITWSTSDSAVAGIDANGLITAKAPGTAVITAASGSARANCTVVVDGYLRTWYTKPANDWAREALPIGNGNLGGMVFGKTDKEQIQVNEITLWSKGNGYQGGNVEGAWKNLKDIQNAMFERVDGDYSGINVGGILGNQAGCGAYQTLGDIYLDFDGAARTATPENYLRELDLQDGMVRVSYENSGIHFAREYIASYPGNVMAIRLTADQENTLSFTLDYDPGSGRTAIADKAEGDSVLYQGKVTAGGMAFAVQVKVVAPDADIICNNDGTIAVKNGEDVLILMSAGTNYDITESNNINNISDFQTADGDYLNNNDPDGAAAAQTVADRLNAAAQKGFAALLKAHMDDYQEIMGRVSLDLGDKEKASLPTDELLTSYKQERSAYAETLLFQFGRYLLLSSSRDSLPANLQGIWNNSNNPGWNSDYHFNVNLQMNYWPAFVTNMSETGMPLVNYMDSLRKPGNVTAREHFGVEKGWVVNTEANPFGKTAPGNDFSWGFTPGSGAWTCQNLWDYYLYTQDPEVLEAIYPILKEGAEFWLGYLVEDPRTRVDGIEGTGELVTAPGGSSEHGPIGVGTTYDMSLAYMEMSYTVEAAKLLGRDAELQVQIEAALPRMHPFWIGVDGQLKEWREESGYSSMPGTDPLHRHLSHLLGMHPGNLISRENSSFSEYYDAAVRALELRDDGSSSVGWSMAQKGNIFARVGNGEMALHHMNLLLTRGLGNNLLDIYVHPGWGDIFQVEANMGYTAGVAEMLIQSHQGYIQPLPALPKEWADGSYTGLVARGNFETDAVWADGSLTDFTIRSGSGGECVVRYPNISKATLTGADFTVVDANTVKFNTVKDGEYTFINIPAYKPVREITVASPSGVTLLEQAGQTIQLTAEAAPVDASDLGVTWKATKLNGTPTQSVVIDQNGLLTATETLARETVKVTAVAKDGSGTMGEILIMVVTDRTAGESKNVALSQPVTMTGADIYDRPDLKLAHINDGSLDTRMAIAGDGQTDADVVFEFQLDGAKVIDRVDLYEYLDRNWGTNGRIDKLTVEIPEGDDWKLVAAKETPDDGSGNGNRLLSITFAPVTADVVRVIATDNDLSSPTIWEVEVYGTELATKPANKVALIAKLNESASLTEEDFNGETGGWSNYVKARTDAIAVANNPAVTQKQVDDALSALTEAIEAGEQPPVHDHTLIHHAAVAATCTTAGNVEYWQCTGCAKRFSDENGNNEITVIEVPALGHAYGEWSVTTPATCTAKGVEIRTCANDTTHQEIRDIPMLKHAYVWKHDDVQHWKLCTVGSEIDESTRAIHIWELNKETSAEFEDHYDCLCGAVKVVDKAALSEAILAVKEDRKDIVVNDGTPFDVPYGTKFVSAETMAVLDTAIATAETAMNTVESDAEVTAAVEALNAAATVFTTAIQTGSYLPPYTPPNGKTDKETVKNEDGSTTTTVTDKKTGDKIITTTYPDGSKVVTTAPKDGEAVSKVTVPAGKTSIVTIPDTGNVPVIMNEDGTEDIIEFSIVCEDGVKFLADKNMTVKVIDNSKTFADVAASHWAADSIQFVARREVFTGTSQGVFNPMGDMTRAMLVTVLARLDGQDTEGGETWYSKAMDWGVKTGVTDGTNAEVGITREQLAVMLYRYAGAEKTQADLSGFADTDSISDWAMDAMNWVVAEGILTGKSGGKLDPSGLASRAEVAAMLQRFIENTLK